MPKTKQVPDKGRETLEALLRVANTKDNLAEFMEAFKRVVAIFAEMKSQHESWQKNGDAWLVSASNFLERKLKELKAVKDGEDGKTPKKGVDYFDGEPGRPGKDADEDRITEKVLSRIKFPEPKTDFAEDIRNKLELLEGDDRLHYSHIGGLDEWEDIRNKKDVTFINGRGSLWGLEDVNVVGLTIGQALQWDGIQWVPYTPSGSAFAGLQEQSTTTPNSSRQTFAFAHAPAIIIWNGAIQFLGTDYTVSGNNITFLTGVPQTSDIILNIYG